LPCCADTLKVSPRPRKFDGLERELPEEAFVLRDARAEGDLVAVLLLELQPDVTDGGWFWFGRTGVFWTSIALPLERLEVAELIEALTLYFSASVLNTPPSSSRISRRMTLSRVVVLPVNVMRLTKNCLPLLHPHRHVDDGRTGRFFRVGSRR
jgi:hypothetical protein